jgi:hypothetical protein
MDNKEFLKVVGESFKKFIETGSRSNEKLKILHGAIANDLKQRLGTGFSVSSLGIGDSKEMKIEGRYIDKAVDITILKNGSPIAGIGVKFVMQNYSQNSNNYFENMLGETANIRCNRFPYFQIFIILDRLPYYDKKKNIKKWETFTEHNISKYVALAKDNVDMFYHTPNKTLIYVVHIPDNDHLYTLDDYLHFYRKHPFNVEVSKHHYSLEGNAVIINDFEEFMDKVYHTILAM